jgi:hypothetical protein
MENDGGGKQEKEDLYWKLLKSNIKVIKDNISVPPQK